jgi:hypothetical protein
MIPFVVICLLCPNRFGSKSSVGFFVCLSRACKWVFDSCLFGEKVN